MIEKNRMFLIIDCKGTTKKLKYQILGTDFVKIIFFYSF